jgi:hypothetical protein
MPENGKASGGMTGGLRKDEKVCSFLFWYLWYLILRCFFSEKVPENDDQDGQFI